MLPRLSRRSLRLLPILALPIAALAAGDAASASTTPPGGSSPDSAVPEGYVRLVDDTNFITVVVPEIWTVVDTAPIVSPEGALTPWILASTVELEEFDTTFTSGVKVQAYPYIADAETVAGGNGIDAGCESIEVQPYTDPVFTGFVQVGTNCGEDGGSWNMVVASPEDKSVTVVVQVQIANQDPANQEAFQRVLDTFTYNPGVALDSLVPSSSVPGSSVPG